MFFRCVRCTRLCHWSWFIFSLLNSFAGWSANDALKGIGRKRPTPNLRHNLEGLRGTIQILTGQLTSGQTHTRRTSNKFQRTSVTKSLYDIKWSLERATRIKWWSNSFCIQHVRHIFWLWCKTLKKKKHSSEITFNMMFVEGNSILFSIPDKGMPLWFKMTELLTFERRKWVLERSENWQKEAVYMQRSRNDCCRGKAMSYIFLCVCVCVCACQRVALII